jgi:alkylhydroperoxidase family enzyme
MRNPDLCRSWLTFAAYIEGNSSALPRRDRAILMLRAAWLSREDYHWGHGVRSARRAGLSDREIQNITKGSKAGRWSASDAALLDAADQLHADQFVKDDTWAALARHYDDRQLLDVIFTVGQYTLVSMFHNTAGTAREEGIDGLPPR